MSTRKRTPATNPPQANLEELLKDLAQHIDDRKTFLALAKQACRGLTQVELAKKMKRKQAYIAQLESGTENNPTLDTLRRLAKALKVTVGELVA